MTNAQHAPPPPGAPTRQPLLSGPIVAALVGLVVLAVITIVVVVNNAPASTPDAAATPSANLERQTATDGSLTYLMPPGYEPDMSGMADIKNYILVIGTRDANGSFDGGGSITAESTADSDASDIAAYAEEVRTVAENTYSTTATDIDPPVATIDGEELVALQFGIMSFPDDPDQTGRAVVTEHDGSFYLFVVNTYPDAPDADYAAFVQFLESVQWV